MLPLLLIPYSWSKYDQHTITQLSLTASNAHLPISHVGKLTTPILNGSIFKQVVPALVVKGTLISVLEMTKHKFTVIFRHDNSFHVYQSKLNPTLSLNPIASCDDDANPVPFQNKLSYLRTIIRHTFPKTSPISSHSDIHAPGHDNSNQWSPIPFVTPKRKLTTSSTKSSDDTMKRLVASFPTFFHHSHVNYTLTSMHMSLKHAPASTLRQIIQSGLFAAP